nr:PREDICTED: pancreatic progenitor cell differentiation and proliferation factor [Struthio camelus australis]
MAAIPLSGSLMATHNYYRRRVSSTSSNSSCGSSDYAGEVIPHPPGKCRPAMQSPALTVHPATTDPPDGASPASGYVKRDFLQEANVSEQDSACSPCGRA